MPATADITSEAKAPGAIKIERQEKQDAWVLTLRMPKDAECWLHWGVTRRPGDPWELPPKRLWPAGSVAIDKGAVQSPFVPEDSEQSLTLTIPKESPFRRIAFVLFYPKLNRWDNNGGKDFFVPVHPKPDAPTSRSEIEEAIVEAETGKQSWTLMHRYNLCRELIDQIEDSPQGWATLLVWLRYSAIRQLDWQRRYNTKPRELSHAQDELTYKLAEAFIATQPENREIIRAMLALVGRGGEGQEIRDEILTIMHRHHVKEVTGHFMEEWHQKLHNNTTPDDIAICEAYLDFLKSDGNQDVFYETLRKHGVTPERLASFERPIVTPPDFNPDIKDGLIHDFEHFLRLLRSIHSGTDLESAADTGRYLMDSSASDALDNLLHHRANPDAPLLELVQNATSVRGCLNRILTTDKDPYRVRDALSLDLALETTLRARVEGSLHTGLKEEQLVRLIDEAIANTRLTHDTDELSICHDDWPLAKWIDEPTYDTLLQALAVTDRLQRAVSTETDRFYQLIQTIAESLGKAFQAEQWTIDTFGEAVVRGRLMFVLSTLLHRLDPLLRKRAGLGGWQVISRGETYGRLQVVQGLSDCTNSEYNEPTVILADRVRGDEEPPPGVTAVITPDPVDLVSHVAVRARNIPVLFATCYEPETLQRLRKLEQCWIHLQVKPSGDVAFEASSEPTKEPIAQAGVRTAESTITVQEPEMGRSPITPNAFRAGLVGGKALNLKHLSASLPPGIETPNSFALPFGVFETTLSLPENRSLKARYDELREDLETVSDPAATLSSLRETVKELTLSDELKQAIQKTCHASGLKSPSNWNEAWDCIKAVWASKWNDRAFLSRKARGVKDDAIHMAVLIQEVVTMDYAFVLHTVNPFTQDETQLYGEVVVGLGETLVANYPGRALSFLCPKETLTPQLLTYPSKSLSLIGDGLIFRSDSNAEDLAGYAGAGLYDSLLSPPPREARLKYSTDPLFQDPDFRTKLLRQIAELGVSVEKALQGPQDIEGGYAHGGFHVVQSRPQIILT